MRLKGMCFLLAVMLCLAFPSLSQAQEPGYFKQMGHVLTRSAKNLVSFPWEIPVTIKKYDKKEDGNYRIFRDAAGFFDGTFRAVTRLGSGIWDLVFFGIPGFQNEVQPQPETFF